MGLAGRKVKQRIPNDPRNLSWVDDANRFGAAYLQKLGWSSGSGLGADGEGRKNHIKVHQKLDMLGIGKAHMNDPNGLAWKQNKDFESLLRRLNGGEEADNTGTKLDGFRKAGLGPASVEGGQNGAQDSKKRKRDDDDTDDVREKDDTEMTTEKRKKEGKKGKKKSKEKRNSEADEEDEGESKSRDDIETSPITDQPQPTVLAHPVRAHRARFLASKRLASKPSTAIDEILGISRSDSSTPHVPALEPSGDNSSHRATTTSSGELQLQALTTSSKSVMDYFKEKLMAKSNASMATSSINSPLPETLPSSSTPPKNHYNDYDDRPRSGLGLGARPGLGDGPSFIASSSDFRAEMTSDARKTDARRGISPSSRLAAMFTSAASLTGSPDDNASVKLKAAHVNDSTGDGETGGKDGRKKRKDKGKEKAKKNQEAESESTKKEKKSKRRKEKEREGGYDGQNLGETAQDSAPKSLKEKRKRKEKSTSTEEVTFDSERKKKKKRRETQSEEGDNTQKKRSKDEGES